MTRFERSLPLLLVLALSCATERAAAGPDVGSPREEPRVTESRSALAVKGADSTTAAVSTRTEGSDSVSVAEAAMRSASDSTQAGDTPRRGVDSAVVVILVLAAVAGLIFLVAR